MVPVRGFELPLNRLRRTRMNRNHKQCTTHPNYIAAKAKGAETRLRKQSQIIFDYNINPTKCATCFAELAYKARKNKFCSRSCSATLNNKNKSVETKEKQKKTLKATLQLKDYYPYSRITLKSCKCVIKNFLLNKEGSAYAARQNVDLLYIQKQLQITQLWAAIKILGPMVGTSQKLQGVFG